MYVIINGVSSDTIQGLQVLSLPPITKPKMRRQVDTIDGRDGDIITELGYEAYDRPITVLLHHNYDLDAITKFFNTSGEIIFSNEPDKKYYFQLLEKIDYERAVQFKTANITFHVQPYKYPVNETPLTVSTTAWEGTDYDQTPYIFRATKDSSVEVGNREIVEQITGGTIAFNQLCNASSVTIASGRKYYMKKGTAYSIGASTGSAITGLTSASDMVIDLTQMFGSTIADYIYSLETATAGAGVSLFKSLFPKDYYSYNAGELMSVKTSARDTTGKNLLNVTSVTVAYRTFTVDSDGWITAENKTSDPRQWTYANCQWFVTLPKGAYSLDFWRNNIGASTSKAISVILNDGTVVVKPYNFGESGSLNFSISNATTVGIMAKLYDFSARLQIRRSDAPTDYEPYQKHTYPLSNIELRGVPKLVNNKLTYDGDTYKADGSVTRRYGIVDLGTLAWTYDSTVPRFYSDDLKNQVKNPSANTVKANAICGKYMTTSLEGDASIFRGTDKSYAISIGRVISIVDKSYTDKTSFKTAMSGVYLVYELASPTTETATPYTETQICSPYGTEEFIDDRDVQVPVGHKTKYMQINDPAEIIVPNAGNVPSAPTIQLTGSGTVGVYLGNAQTLQVNIPEDGITIDTEAQDATSNGQLANRSVTGDYDSVRLQPGDNDVSFSGDFSAVITKYTRWV